MLAGAGMGLGRSVREIYDDSAILSVFTSSLFPTSQSKIILIFIFSHIFLLRRTFLSKNFHLRIFRAFGEVTRI